MIDPNRWGWRKELTPQRGGFAGLGLMLPPAAVLVSVQDGNHLFSVLLFMSGLAVLVLGTCAPDRWVLRGFAVVVGVNGLIPLLMKYLG